MHDHISTADLAEDVAAITFAITEALASYPDANISDDSRYHIYGGFPGFTDHTARAAQALHHALAPYHIDNAIELFERYASAVIASDRHTQRPSAPDTMADRAEHTRLWALSEGLLSPRPDVTGRAAITHTSWAVSFTLTLNFQTIVTAASEDEAIAIGEHLYAEKDTAAFTRRHTEDNDWSADPTSP
ncbi:MAG: hypothetical protein C0519_09650 [Hyphomicrobium sp.]|nr:hypothetical protein [Hyphomicrobium sp.]